MLEKLLTRIYLFVFAVLLAATIFITNAFMDNRSDILKMSLTLLVLTIFIVLFFDLMRAVLTRDKGSYRTMVIERPLFNPRGKADHLKMIYPLYPRFIALYFDKTGDREENYQLVSIQAVRYENGYLTDGLFLPIRRNNGKNRKRDLTIQDAFRYLMTYTKDFPLVVHELDYANSFVLKTTNSPMLMYALDTQVISKMIYPKLKSHGIEDINYHMNIEFDDEDPIYGAKIVAAIYLDYLRLHNYKTNVTFSFFARKSDLKAVYPKNSPRRDDYSATVTDSWEEDEEKYQIPENGETTDLTADVSEMDPPAPVAAEDSGGAEPAPENLYPFKGSLYIGPFTPLDENGDAIPDHPVALRNADVTMIREPAPAPGNSYAFRDPQYIGPFTPLDENGDAIPDHPHPLRNADLRMTREPGQIPENPYISKDPRYIGPFTPLDENGDAIPDHPHPLS